MTDEATGSWWQQVSGAAVQGPSKGRRLKLVAHDELSFALWKAEHPQGRVLRPEAALLAADEYAPANWEARMQSAPVVTPNVRPELPPRTLILGLVNGESATAYPIDLVRSQRAVLDVLGDLPLLVVIGPDGRSARAFDRRVDGRTLEFFAPADSTLPWALTDGETGSSWSFAGLAESGPLAGRRLETHYLLPDYWFDWQTYHPRTQVYDLASD